MKKRIAWILVLALVMGVFTGCCLKHEWKDATCVDPVTCAKCDKTDGEPLGHDWKAATCEAPETCADCGETQGQALGHDWKAATCEAPETCADCGDTQGETLEHHLSSWVISGDNIAGDCANCGAPVEEPIDWESFSLDLIRGRWKGLAVVYGENYAAAPEGTYVEFADDGTTKLQLGEELHQGTWEFDIHDIDGEDSCLFYDTYFGEEQEYFTGIIFDNTLTEMSLVQFIGDTAVVLVFER